MPKRWDRFRETFSLDLRSLALLRVALGLMLLVDLAIRVVDLPDHYTDAGILPRAFHEPRFFEHHPARFSLHMLSGDLPLQIALVALAAVCAVALSAGFYTRTSLLLSLVLYISIQNRNNEIETGGDYLLRLVCFWCLFLPMGARFSLDRRAGRVVESQSGGARNRHFSVASVALIVQMMCVYFFSALHKDHPIWRKDFSAIHYALHIDAYDTSLGVWLRDYPALTSLMTRATLVFEYAAPWFLVGAGLLSLLPACKSMYSEQGSSRTLAVSAFILFHLSLGISMSLGTFAWFAAIIWWGFFPTEAWDAVNAFIDRVQSGARVEESGTEANEDDEEAEDDEIHEDDENHEDDEDDEQAAQESSPPPAWSVPWGLRLGRIRAFILRNEAALRPAPAGVRGRRRAIATTLGQGFAGICAIIVVLWNVATVEGSAMRYLRGKGPLPDTTAVVDLLRLDQHWGLFAPYPRTSDGYYVVVAHLKDGQKIDLLSPGFELTWEKPDDVSGSYKTFRWRKYFRNLRRRSKRSHRGLYANYVCNRYNESFGKDNPARRVEIYFMRRATRRSGGHKPTQKERIWRQTCKRTSEHTSANEPPSPVRSAHL